MAEEQVLKHCSFQIFHVTTSIKGNHLHDTAANGHHSVGDKSRKAVLLDKSCKYLTGLVTCMNKHRMPDYCMPGTNHVYIRENLKLSSNQRSIKI